MRKNTGKITKSAHVRTKSKVRPATATTPSEPFEPFMLQSLKDSEVAKASLNYVLREGELSDVLALLKDIAKAQGGFSKLARETGLSRVNLYNALSESGNPRFDSIAKVLHSLGLQVAVERRAMSNK